MSLGLLIVCNSLFNPYTPIYDLILLMIGGICLTEGLSSQGRVASLSPNACLVAVATLYFGPHLSQSLAPVLGVQLFPLILLVGCAVALTRWSTALGLKKAKACTPT